MSEIVIQDDHEDVEARESGTDSSFVTANETSESSIQINTANEGNNEAEGESSFNEGPLEVQEPFNSVMVGMEGVPQIISFAPIDQSVVVETGESDGNLADTEDSNDRFSLEVYEPARSGSEMSQFGGDGDEASDSSGVGSSNSDSLVVLASETANATNETSSHTTNLSIPMTEKSKTIICGKYGILGFSLKPRAAPGHRYVVSLDEVLSRRQYEMKLPTWVPTYAQRINCILNNFLRHFIPEDEKEKEEDDVQIIHPKSSGKQGGSQEISEEEIGQSIRLVKFERKSCLKLTPNVTIGESKPKNIQWSQQVSVDIKDNEKEEKVTEQECLNNDKLGLSEESQSLTTNSTRKVQSCPGIFVLEERLLKLKMLEPCLMARKNETYGRKSFKERLKDFFRIKNCQCLACLWKAKKKQEAGTAFNTLRSKCDDNTNPILSSTSLDPDTSRDEGGGSDPISPTEPNNNVIWETLSIQKKSLPSLSSKNSKLAQVSTPNVIRSDDELIF